MNKTQLTSAVAEKAEISKAQAAKLVDTLLGVIADNICTGDKEIAIPDFGRFFVKKVPARQGINPQTKEKITIEEHEKIVFKPSDNMDVFSRKHN